MKNRHEKHVKWRDERKHLQDLRRSEIRLRLELKRRESRSEGERHRLKHAEEQYRQLHARPPLKWILVGILAFNVAIAGSWFLAYWIMGFVYRTWFPDVDHPLVRQYLTVVLAVFILFNAMGLARNLFKPLRHNINLFMMMSKAMQKMAKGDFDNVSLDFDPRFLGQLSPLVTSFNNMATELSQIEQMRQEFISNVSHEFQSPLTSIGGFARALKSDQLTPEMRQHYLDIIETESGRLSRLSDNLLKLTSLESKQHPFEPKLYRLDRQLRRIVLSCEPLWLDKNLEMDVELPERSITADEELMNQVWINLLHNCIKFTPEGGKILIRVADYEDKYRILIEDTGIGIAEEHLPHLFERFYKVDKARNRTASGSGLGLSIVGKIIEMHGGEITVGSRPNEGTAFTIQLPVICKARIPEEAEADS